MRCTCSILTTTLDWPQALCIKVLLTVDRCNYSFHIVLCIISVLEDFPIFFCFILSFCVDAKAQFVCVGKSGSLGWLGTTDSLGPPQADTGTLIALLSTSLANTAHHCVLLTNVLLCVVLFWPTVVLDFSSWSMLVLLSTAHCPLCYCPMSTLVLWSLCC